MGHNLLHYCTQYVACQAFAHTLCYILNMENFGEELKALRLSMGVSQKVVSSALGLTRNAFTNYENGIREPSLETLKKICVYFDVSSDYLLGLSDK